MLIGTKTIVFASVILLGTLSSTANAIVINHGGYTYEETSTPGLQVWVLDIDGSGVYINAPTITNNLAIGDVLTGNLTNNS